MTAGVPFADTAMFRGLLGEIVSAVEPTTEADPVGVYASLISGTGAFVGPNPHYRVGLTRHPMLIWSLLFGRTGSGRKGEAEQAARTFLRAALPENYASIKVSGLSSGEGLIERIRDPDPSNEKDAGGTDDKRLLVVEQEFGAVMARTKNEGSTLGPVLRDAWAGEALTKLNRRAYGASWSHIAIVGHVTPREFKARMADGEMAGGTFNRFLPLYIERSKKLPIPSGVDDDTIAELAGALRDAIQRARGVGRVEFDDEARRLWCDELYDEFTEADDEDEPWTEFARRGAPNCLRIASLSAALEGRWRIGKADLAAAGALVRYSVASAKYVLGPRRDPRFDRLVRALDAAGAKGMTRTQIFGLFSRNVEKKVLDQMLAELVESGDCEVAKIPTGGRPIECFVATKKAK